MKRARAAAALGSCFILLVAVDAVARPGGGHAYSGGGSSSGGGGGSSGGGGDLIFFLLRLVLELCLDAPAIGIPLVLVVIVGFIVAATRHGSSGDWNGPSESAVAASQLRARPTAPNLSAILERDPEFSAVLFEDFVYALFAAAHRARHDAKKLTELAPYLDDDVRQALAARAPAGVPVVAALVGVLRMMRVDTVPSETRVTVEFEANLFFANGAPTLYERERWVLHRAAAARSRVWAKTRSFVCPNCGAPFDSTDSQVCQYCKQVVSNGRFDWSVASAALLESSARPPSLTGTVEERGTDLATIHDPGFESAWERLRADDPAVTEQGMAGRLALVHREFTLAWNAQDLARVRGLVSDGLFDYLGYWISAYRAQGLRNVVDGAALVRVDPVKLVRDVHYDAFTFRVFATGQDYTLDSRGAVVGGNRSRNRDYSEYWTLIRGAGTRGATRAEPVCPSCGAELKVEMSGQCAFCHARVTTGGFDWVLSKIEQDDSYAG